jgi:hypothetical protein
MKYICSEAESFWIETEIEAETAAEAALKYVDGGDWGGRVPTKYVYVHVTASDGSVFQERIAVVPSKEKPQCKDGHDHDWQTPHEVVREPAELRFDHMKYPGVWSYRTLTLIDNVCPHCGKYRHTSISDEILEGSECGSREVVCEVIYADADDSSLAWIGARARMCNM